MFRLPSLPNALTFTANEIRVVAGNGNPKLAERVAQELGVKLTACHVGSRACGEVVIKVDPEIRGKDVYVVQATGGYGEIDINQTVLELLFLVRRLKLTGAARITAIVPFFAYARQDRKCDLRSPISASAVAQLIDRMGVDRVVTLDLHSGQIQGYFTNRAPLDNLQMAQEFAQYIRTCRWFDPQQTVIVSPDAGGVARAHAFADLLRVSHIVTVVKRRAKAGVIGSMQTVGDVAGYTCIIIDDMCDTGGTLVAACRLLKEMGATRVVACITHGILTDPCIKRVNECEALNELVVSDSLPQEENLQRCTKLHVLGIAALLAQALKVYNSERSISELFRKPSTPSPALLHPTKTVSPILFGAPEHLQQFPSHPPSNIATPPPAGAGAVGSTSTDALDMSSREMGKDTAHKTPSTTTTAVAP